MRSEVVFRAQDCLANRYLLCRTTAKVTRLLHFLSDNTSDAINDAFVQVANPRGGRTFGTDTSFERCPVLSVGGIGEERVTGLR